MKRSAGYFIVELIIVTLGVSFSLLMNELREQRQKQEREIEILKVIQSNLEMDSVNLWRHQYALRIFQQSALKMREVTHETPLDSLDKYLDCVTSYSMFNMVDVGFQELRSGNLQLVLSNDSLNLSIIRYYTDMRSYVEEWNNIDRQFILNSLIPYVVENFPALAIEEQPRFAVKEFPPQDLLQSSHFQNLLANYVIYKKGVYILSDAHKAFLAQLRKSLDKEIKRLQEEI